MPLRDDFEAIAEEEREIVDRVSGNGGPLRAVESAELLGSYPDTVIRITATRDRQTEVHDWFVWNGQVTGAPPGVGSGPVEYAQLLDAQILYWLSSPTWKSHTLVDR